LTFGLRHVERRVKRRTCSDSEVRSSHPASPPCFVLNEKTRVRSLIHDLQLPAAEPFRHNCCTASRLCQHVIPLFIQRFIPPFRRNNVPPQSIWAAPIRTVSNLLTNLRTMTPTPRFPAHLFLSSRAFINFTPQFWRSVVGVPTFPFSGPLDCKSFVSKSTTYPCVIYPISGRLKIRRAQGFLGVLSVARPRSKIKFETSNVIPSVVSLTALVMRKLPRALSLISRSRGVVAFRFVGRIQDFRSLSCQWFLPRYRGNIVKRLQAS